MRIFLSPPFYFQRACRHCAKIFYKQFPDSWWWRYEVEKMPPLGTYKTNQGFIPDYPILTMFDEFVIDGEACERLTSKTTPKWFGAWPDVIQLLKAEGALSTVDSKAELAKNAQLRGSMLRRDMKDVTTWSEAMSYYSTLFAAADKAFPPELTSSKNLAWDYDPEDMPSIKGSDGQYHALSAGPLMKPGNDPHDPHFELHEIALNELRSQLREVNAGLAISAQLNCAPMFWAPYKLYLKNKARTLAQTGHEQGEASRLFFKIAFPKYQPDSIKDLRRLREDRRVRQLRDVILSSAKSGDSMDPKYPQRVLEEVFHLERRIGKIRQIMGWISSAIGFIPVPGISLVSTVANELASTGVENWLRRDWHWFYLISDGTGHS